MINVILTYSAVLNFLCFLCCLLTLRLTFFGSVVLIDDLFTSCFCLLLLFQSLVILANLSPTSPLLWNLWGLRTLSLFIAPIDVHAQLPACTVFILVLSAAFRPSFLHHCNGLSSNSSNSNLNNVPSSLKRFH